MKATAMSRLTWLVVVFAVVLALAAPAAAQVGQSLPLCNPGVPVLTPSFCAY